MTMQEIGRILGVSKVTVSKALNNRPGVSDETREKIRSTAIRMGYLTPENSTGPDVGVLIPSRFFAPDSYYCMLYKGLVEKLNGAGCTALLELLTETMETELRLPNLLLSRHIDVLVLLGEPRTEYIQAVTAQDIPVIFLDFYDGDADNDAIIGDSTYGTYRLTGHLIAGGHTKIGFVGEPLSTSSIMDRYLGFSRALICHRIPEHRKWVIPDRDEHGNTIEIILPDELPTAFVCSCDLTACLLMDALAQKGLRVPEDISVVGFDDFCGGMKPSVPLSTFRIDHEGMIRKTVQIILKRTVEKQRIGGRVVIGGEPVYRDSDRKLVQKNDSRTGDRQ